MTRWMTLGDGDSDGINKAVRCDCSAGEDHYQDVPEPDSECSECLAILDGHGLCWYCDRPVYVEFVGKPWPCPTIRALTGAYNIQEGG